MNPTPPNQSHNASTGTIITAIIAAILGVGLIAWGISAIGNPPGSTTRTPTPRPLMTGTVVVTPCLSDGCRPTLTPTHARPTATPTATQIPPTQVPTVEPPVPTEEPTLQPPVPTEQATVPGPISTP